MNIESNPSIKSKLSPLFIFHNWPDLIKSIACYLVVLLHSSAPACYLYNKIATHEWLIAAAINSICRVAVPLFFMVSGAMLLGKEESLIKFTKKRASKIAIPLLFWSIIFILFPTYVENVRSISIFAPLEIIFGPTYYHLWFIYALLGTYVFVAFFRLTGTQNKKYALIFFTIVWFIASSLLPVFSKVSGISSRFDLSVFTGYAGYLSLGYLISLSTINKKQENISVITLIICIAITIYGTYYLTHHNSGVLRSDFYDPLAPTVVIASTCAFILLKNIYYTKISQYNISNKIFNSISKCSFGIYFIHPIFLYFLEHGTFGLKISVLEGNPLFQIPLVATLTFMLSMCLTLILQRTPVLKHTI